MTVRRAMCVLLVCAVVATTLVAAELEERTRAAYDEYVSEARQRFLDRVTKKGDVLPEPAVAKALRDGRPIARPGSQGGIISIPKGLVHHWAGGIFIPDVTLRQVLAVSHAYENYQAIYDSIIASRLSRREGDRYFLELRAREGVRGVTVVLDIRSSVEYFYPTPTFAYALSATHEIREVKNAGSPNEHLLPVGQDSGYLWGASTFTTFTERDGGVYLELETFGLSRRFPPLMGWIIQPIARRLGRKSVEGSLEEFRTAILATHDTAVARR